MAAPGTFKRTLKRPVDHSHRLLMTTPYRLVRRTSKGAAPAALAWLVAVLSYWLNQQDGDCVTAESCANAATGNNDYIISDQAVQSFGQRYGLLNGADLANVNQIMQSDGLPDNTKLFKEGPIAAVDWTNWEEMTAALSELGPAGGLLKIAIDATELEGAANDSLPFNFAFNFRGGNGTDHCTGLAGYGTAQSLLDALNALYAAKAQAAGQSYSSISLPSGIDPATPSLAMFSWKRYFIIDWTSLKNIMRNGGECYIRQPSSIMTTNPNPGPGPSPAPQHPTRRGLALGIELADLQAEGHSVFVESELVRLRSNIDSYRLQRSLAKRS
jgi:hypothetical protein